MDTRRLKVALIALTAAGVLPCAFALTESGVPELTRARPVDPVVISLQPYMGLLRTIDVTIGEVTLPFLFDTAGGFTAVTPQLAERLGVEPFGRVTGYRASGERLDVARAGEVDLAVSGLGLRSDVVIFDLMGLLPAGWPELGGLLSLHTFREHAVTLELAENRLTVETEESLARRIRDLSPMSTRLNTQMGYSLDLFVEVKAPRGNLWLELDGGNLGPLLLAPHAVVQLGLQRPRQDATSGDASGGGGTSGEGGGASGGTTGTTGGEASGSVVETAKTGSNPDSLGIVTLDYVGLGPIATQASRADIIYDGLVDAATVQKLILTMDLRSGKTWGRIR